MVAAVACDDSTSSGTSSGVPGSSGGSTTVPTPDAIVAGGSCPAPSGGGTDHAGTVSADETWAAAGSPHRVTSSLDIRATLTIEACAVVEVASGATISVGSPSVAGSLVTKGTFEGGDLRPVVIRGSGWQSLAVEAKGTASLTLTAVVGSGAGGDGALVARGIAGGTNGGAITRNLAVDRVVVQDSASVGVNLDAWGAFADGSDNLWIRGGGSDAEPSAMRLEIGVAATLPKTMGVTGNVRDEILIRSSKTFISDDTLVARGVPYRAKGPIWVARNTDGAAATLTIEPGVTLGFDDGAGSGMTVGSSTARPGVLVAEGTADAPIVFTSGKPTKAAGDWTNITFKTPISGNRIANARFEYAGAASQTNSFGCGPKANDAAVIVFGQGADQGAPASSLITSTTFDNIGGTTVIVSGWVDDAGPNLTGDNVFGPATPGCKVSKPRRTGAGDVCDGDRTTCW